MGSLIIILQAVAALGLPAPRVAYYQLPMVDSPASIGCTKIVGVWADSATSPAVVVCDAGKRVVIVQG